MLTIPLEDLYYLNIKHKSKLYGRVYDSVDLYNSIDSLIIALLDYKLNNSSIIINHFGVDCNINLATALMKRDWIINVLKKEGK